MLFLTWTYLAFLVFSFITYWFVVPSQWRREFLLTVSTAFFFYHYPKPTLLIISLILVVYLMAHILKQDRFKFIYIPGVLLILAPLIYFKYTGLILSSVNDLLKIAGNQESFFTVPNIIIPLGISFFTFKLVHYLVDVYKGKIEKLSLIDFALYIMFIPILPSGPIERYQPFEKQTAEQKAFSSAYLTEGTYRILGGLFKKFIIADSMGIFTAALNTPGGSTTAYWLGVYAYAIKIYFDFSGYSDIAIGSARLFGYKIMENFNWPYLQRNISLFWKNWHMSLTGWFRDYVFIPLGGSRGSFGRVILNSFIVMAVTGIWHGAAWHFMFWGFYHGVGLIGLRLFTKYCGPKLGEGYLNSRFIAVLSTLFTFHFVAIGWIFFVVDIDLAFHILYKLFMLDNIFGG